MKKSHILIITILLINTLFLTAEQKKYTTVIGASATVNKISLDDVDIIPFNVGVSLLVVPEDHGFLGLTSITIPVYAIADGLFTKPSGITTDLILGYGKTFKFDVFNLTQGIISIGGGLHSNFMVFIEQSAVTSFVNLGPGIMLTTGNSSSRIRASLEFHYDFFSYTFGNLGGQEFSGSMDSNFGGSVLFGFSI